MAAVIILPCDCSDGNDYLCSSGNVDSILDESTRIEADCASLSSQNSSPKDDTVFGLYPYKDFFAFAFVFFLRLMTNILTMILGVYTVYKAYQLLFTLTSNDLFCLRTCITVVSSLIFVLFFLFYYVNTYGIYKTRYFIC